MVKLGINLIQNFSFNHEYYHMEVFEELRFML